MPLPLPPSRLYCTPCPRALAAPLLPCPTCQAARLGPSTDPQRSPQLLLHLLCLPLGLKRLAGRGVQAAGPAGAGGGVLVPNALQLRLQHRLVPLHLRVRLVDGLGMSGGVWGSRVGRGSSIVQRLDAAQRRAQRAAGTCPRPHRQLNTPAQTAPVHAATSPAGSPLGWPAAARQAGGGTAAAAPPAPAPATGRRCRWTR